MGLLEAKELKFKMEETKKNGKDCGLQIQTRVSQPFLNYYHLLKETLWWINFQWNKLIKYKLN